MRIRKLLKEDDAVSPVIGVILMVAITVILAAVIASFVLGLGDSADDVSPTASFNFDYDGGASEITVTHDGGDSVEAQELIFRGSGYSETGQSWDSVATDTSVGATSEVTSGQTAKLTTTSSAYEVTLNWEKIDGDQSSKLGDSEGPDA